VHALEVASAVISSFEAGQRVHVAGPR
jgi:hypothetical protein